MCAGVALLFAQTSLAILCSAICFHQQSCLFLDGLYCTILSKHLKLLCRENTKKQAVIARLKPACLEPTIMQNNMIIIFPILILGVHVT